MIISIKTDMPNRFSPEIWYVQFSPKQIWIFTYSAMMPWPIVTKGNFSKVWIKPDHHQFFSIRIKSSQINSIFTKQFGLGRLNKVFFLNFG